MVTLNPHPQYASLWYGTSVKSQPPPSTRSWMRLYTAQKRHVHVDDEE